MKTFKTLAISLSVMMLALIVTNHTLALASSGYISANVYKDQAKQEQSHPTQVAAAAVLTATVVVPPAAPPAAAVLSPLTAATPVPVAIPSGIPSSGTTSNNCQITLDSARLEAIQLQQINSIRASAGIAPVTLDSGLSTVARIHSCDMGWMTIDHGIKVGFSHIGSHGRTPLQRMVGAGLGENGRGDVGENISYTSHDSVATSANTYQVTALVTSKVSQDWNVLHAAYNEVGIGVIVIDGQTYVTEDFIDSPSANLIHAPTPIMTTAPAPKAPASMATPIVPATPTIRLTPPQATATSVPTLPIPVTGMTSNNCHINAASAQLEADRLAQINVARAKAGVAPVRLDARLSNVARIHSCDLRWMIKDHGLKEGFSHNGSNGQSPFRRMVDAGFSSKFYGDLGENMYYTSNCPISVAANFYNTVTLAEPLVFKNGENSHKWNMLHSAYNVVGIGVIVVDNQTYLTEDYAQDYSMQTHMRLASVKVQPKK